MQHTEQGTQSIFLKQPQRMHGPMGLPIIMEYPMGMRFG